MVGLCPFICDTFVTFLTIQNVDEIIVNIGKYQSNPGVAHQVTIKNILKYLRRTNDMFLIGYEVEFVSGYIDGSFQTDRDDNK